MILPLPVMVATASIHLNPANFRETYELDTLMESIRQHGILQPPGIWEDKERGCYHAIFGNRRIASALRLGIPEIPALVFPGPLPPGEAETLQLIENLLRVDLKPSEQAKGFQQLLKQGLSATEVAERLSVANSTVTKKVALLRLIPALLELVDAGQLPETSGYEIATSCDAKTQAALAANFKETGRVTREEVRDRIGGEEPKKPSNRLTFKLQRGSLTYRGDELAELIEELATLLKAAKKAKEEGTTDVPSFAKRLRENKVPA